MLDRYMKLVIVAEVMVTRLNECHEELVQLNVSVSGDKGVVGLGVFGHIGNVYYPDENQYMPEYDTTYESYDFFWVEGEWVSEHEKRIEREVSAIEDYDELPF
jgi:hypothetical protein